MSTRAPAARVFTASCGHVPRKSASSRSRTSVEEWGSGFRRRHLLRREWTYEESDPTSESRTLPSRASAWLAIQTCTGQLPRSSIAETDQSHTIDVSAMDASPDRER